MTFVTDLETVSPCYFSELCYIDKITHKPQAVGSSKCFKGVYCKHDDAPCTASFGYQNCAIYQDHNHE